MKPSQRPRHRIRVRVFTWFHFLFIFPLALILVRIGECETQFMFKNLMGLLYPNLIPPPSWILSPTPFNGQYEHHSHYLSGNLWTCQSCEKGHRKNVGIFLNTILKCWTDFWHFKELSSITCTGPTISLHYLTYSTRGMHVSCQIDIAALGCKWLCKMKDP